MGGVSVEGGGGGRRSLDSEINMIPMIDLLMCLICFLLITAVWSTMARLNADAQVPGPPRDTEIQQQEPQPMLHVTIQADEKFVLSWRKGGAVVSTVDVPMKPVTIGEGRNAQIKFPDLATKITEEWKANGSHRDPSDKKMDQAVLHCDNKTPYKQIVAVIDAVYQTKRLYPGGGDKPYPSLNVTFAMTSNLGRRQMSIHKPGRRLMHHVGLNFVQKKVTGGGHRGVAAALNLTSMIDFLVTIVVFLLMSFSASGEIPTDKTITLPMAENTLDMITAPMVQINGSQILVNQHPVGSTRAVEEAGRVMPRIDELFAALKSLKDDWKKLNPGGKEFPGVVILQVDKEVPALVVKSVFQTSASAGYPNVSFMVGKMAEKKAGELALLVDETRTRPSFGAAVLV